MARQSEFVEFVLELLAPLGNVRARAMFGGHGIYRGEVMFAIIDEEQDLLRAMLTFASAGLDSMVKQLVLDALPTVINHDSGANQMFKTFIERRLRKGDTIDHSLLADILGDEHPRIKLIKSLIAELTNESLQSTEQLLRVGSLIFPQTILRMI